MADPNAWPELSLNPIEEEDHRLLAIQRRHHLELYARGIVDKALESDEVTDSDKNSMNDLTWATVHQNNGVNGDGDKRVAAKVRFVTPQLNSGGNYFAPHIAFARVAYYYPKRDELDVAEGFTKSDADVVLRMLEELKQARADGILPHLADSLSVIPFNLRSTPSGEIRH